MAFLKSLLILFHLAILTSARRTYIMENSCGSSITMNPGDEILIKLVEDGSYPDNTTCGMNIFINYPSTSSSSLIVSFLDIDIESSAQCLEDYVELTDVKTGNSIGRLCGQDFPIHLSTESTQIYLHFKSGHQSSKNGGGFAAKITFDLKGAMGGTTMKSPGGEGGNLPKWAEAVVVIGVLITSIWVCLCICKKVCPGCEKLNFDPIPKCCK